MDEVETRFEGFGAGSVDRDGDACLLLRWTKDLALTPGTAFEASASFRAACRAGWVEDLGWTRASASR